MNMNMKRLFACASASAFLLCADFASAQVSFSLDKASYGSSEDIIASWTNGPGNANDWIGIYPRGVTPSPGSSAWLYVNGTTTATEGVVDGSVTFTPFSLPGAGDWTAWYLLEDGYTPAAEGVDFTCPGHIERGVVRAVKKVAVKIVVGIVVEPNNIVAVDVLGVGVGIARPGRIERGDIQQFTLRRDAKEQGEESSNGSDRRGLHRGSPKRVRKGLGRVKHAH